MDLNTITVADFKAFFPRDFSYLPVWSFFKIYNAGAIVYYSETELFYKARSNGIPMGTLPTDETYWEIYPDDIYNYVLDSDIEKAFAEAKVNFNQSLFANDEDIRIGYLYLTAFYLVNDLQTAQAGIQAVGIGLLKSRTVGSVSESYEFPQWIMEFPFYAFLYTNRYGMKYLSLILPYLVGNVQVVAGTTLP